MSYDLYIKSPSVGSTTSPDLEGYFSGRAHYTVEATQILYENESTGVHFIIDLPDMEDMEDMETDSFGVDDADGSIAVAIINYCRPRYFIREISMEVASLFDTFPLRVYDPQGDMANGIFDISRLIEGWEHGNRLCCGRMGRESLTLPGSVLDRSWEWNRRIPALQSELDETQDVFVPRISFFVVDGEVTPLAVWPDGIPIAMPPVERLLVVRQRLALDPQAQEVAILPVADAQSLFEAHRCPRSDEILVMNFDTPPGEVQEFVTSLPIFVGQLEPLAPGHVVDEEYCE